MKSAERPCFGFTLVEVLVVIAVVAILAGLLVPVVTSAKKSAAEPTCISNQRQIGVAVDLYCGDHDQRYPDAVDGVEANSKCPGIEPVTGHPVLAAVLKPYVRAAEIWRCPEDRGIPSTVPTDEAEPAQCMAAGAAPSVYAVFGSSYGYQSGLGLAGITDPPSGARGTGASYGPADVAVSWDIYGSWHGGPTDPEKRYETLFADGHVSLLPPPEWNQAAHIEF